jgi:hypothetical protein
LGRREELSQSGDFAYHQEMTAGAFVPAPPHSARLAQVCLSLVLALVLVAAGVGLFAEPELWLPAASVISMALLIGIFALQAKHRWSWAASIIVLWLLGGVCAALGTFVVDEVDMHSNASDYLVLGARVFVVAIPCGLPTYMTFVPRVRRRFRERAQILRRLRHEATESPADVAQWRGG